MLNISQVILVRTDSNLCRKELTVHWSAPNSLIRSYLQPCTNSMWGDESEAMAPIITDCGCPKGGSFLSKSSHNSPEIWLAAYMSLHCISGSHPGWLPTWASTASVALTPAGCLHEPPLHQWLSPQLAAYMSLHCISGSHPGWLPTWASTASVALTPAGCLHEPPLHQWLSPQLAAYMSLHCISGSHPSWLPSWASTASVALTHVALI